MTSRTLSRPAAWILGLIFLVMAGVGTAGAYGTYRNMDTAFGSGTALGVVAAGEGATAVLGLTLIGLTLISRPYPLALRLGLWLIPLAGSATGAAVAPDDRHAVIYATTPLAMTVAAELAGYLARSIVVHRTGVDAEADRRTGETLRLIEFHQARSQHHPKDATRSRSQRAAWRLAKQLGKGGTAVGTALPTAYADRTADAALAALDALYGRTPAPVLASVGAAPAAAVTAVPEPAPVATAPVPVEPPALPQPAPTPAPAPAVEDVQEEELLPEFDAPYDVEAFDTGDDDADTEPAPAVSPAPGGRLTDVELDVVLHMIRTETNPPRSYREMEARFRELGYIAGAARLRAAWERVTATAEQTTIGDLD
jgi:hypothetical protein